MPAFARANDALSRLTLKNTKDQRVTAPPTAHRIFDYDPPRRLAENLWQVRGSLRIPIPRNMTVWRAPDGRLVLYSVVAMHEDGMRALEALGEPAFMVIPHKRHHMDAPFYRARYPNLRALAETDEPANGVNIDGRLDELRTLGVTGGPIPGTNYDDVAMDVAIPGGRALCVCELMGNVPASGVLQSLALRLLGPPGGTFGVSRVVKLREVVQKDRVREWLIEQSRRTDLLMLLFGHGTPILSQVPAALNLAARQI